MNFRLYMRARGSEASSRLVDLAFSGYSAMGLLLLIIITIIIIFNANLTSLFTVIT